MFANLVHMKALLMVIAAAGGTVAGTSVVGSYLNHGASFLVTLNPSTMTTAELATSSSTVTVMSVNGYSGTVGLSLYYPGQKLTSSLSPTSVTVNANSQAQSTLSLTAPNSTGTYTIVVIGVSTSHGKTSYSTSMLTLHVSSRQDFTITSSLTTITNFMGATNTTTITVTSENGYTGNVNLTVTIPFGYITVTGGQETMTLSPDGSATSILTISTALNTPQGSYSVVVTGSDGTRSHSATIMLNVNDPVPVEQLVNAGYQFVNGTDLLLNLQNTGNASATIQSYTVQDDIGDAYTMSSLTGPTINPGMTGTLTTLIGSSCPTCIYSGITGLFLTFVPGHTYTIVVTTTRNNQFTFNVTR